MKELTTQQAIDEFANSYQVSKRDTMINLLECGHILYKVKEKLGYGVWCQFLQDTRVSESERTAHRLTSIYKNYRHLLNKEYRDKASNLSTLGVSHLLELQKLPDRFKKEIQVVKENTEEMEVVKVIDEEKLGDFLEQQVDHEGEKKHVRDLPLSEMKKYIKEAQGVYEPEEQDWDKQETDEETDNDTDVEIEDNQSEGAEQVKSTRDNIDNLIENLNTFNTMSLEIMNQLQEVDLSTIASISDKKAADLKKLVKQAYSSCEGVMVRSQEVKDKI